MTEPTTVNQALIVPNTGDLVGAWGTAALNPNFSSIDGLFGGIVSLSLSAATSITLTAPAGSITPSAGPNQAQNFALSFSGTLSGNAVITLPLPGRYICYNKCTVGTSYIQLRAVGTGNLIGVPDGRPTTVWSDGTNVYFCDQAEVGSYMDLAMATTPSWFAGCSNLPYLICDGTVFTSSIFPILSGRLGSTFGGNGITTFAVPDLRARYRLPLDNQGSQGAAGRVTNAVSSVNGTALGAFGGNQAMQTHGHVFTGTQQTWGVVFGSTWNGNGMVPGAATPGSSGFWSVAGGSITANVTVTPSGTISSTGSGSSQNMPPTLVSGMTLIKTDF